MVLPYIPAEIAEYYTNTIDESDRLTSSADGRLELLRTQELLRRHLPPPPAAILDVGSGPGVHARWLTSDGYRVELIDAVDRHVDEAKAAGLNARLGDARTLDVPAGSFDVVLLLGPLYHLLDRGDRITALEQARRALRPGGLLAAAAINRYASLFENTANTLLSRERVQVSIAGILATGRLERPVGFTTSYFHQPDELIGEIADAGFNATDVYSIEGPTWGLLKAIECHSGDSLINSPMFQAALTVARMTEQHPALLAASSHLLAFGHA
jgi:SAM-dependent methyltransferase